MNLLARGKVLKQDGDMATIQLSNEELGRAVLSYVVNNVDGSIGEKFMQNLFAGKPMSLNDMLLSNVIEAKKTSDFDIDNDLKKNNKVEDVKREENVVELKAEPSNNYINKEDVVDDDFKIELLRTQGETKVRILDIKESCRNVYERVVKTKNGISSQIIANCDIVFTFGENNVTYSFISYKKGMSNVITPNNNLVFVWEDATSEELDELTSLI